MSVQLIAVSCLRILQAGKITLEEALDVVSEAVKMRAEIMEQ